MLASYGVNFIDNFPIGQELLAKNALATGARHASSVPVAGVWVKPCLRQAFHVG